MTTSDLASVPRFEPRVDPRPDDSQWPVMTWPPAADAVLRGRVVELTQFDTDRDAVALFDALDSDDVWRHQKGRAVSSTAFAASLVDAAALGRVPWVLRLTVDHAGLPAGSVVGMSSYLDASAEDARLEIGSTAYARPVWASGVNPDAKLQLMTHAFEVLGAGRVQLKTDVRNVRSQQAIARLGAQYEGTLRRYQRRTDGTVRDTVFFSVLAEDWPTVRDGLTRRVDAALEVSTTT
jgi:RimJ/RimL family protein N-acetyltransferase